MNICGREVSILPRGADAEQKLEALFEKASRVQLAEVVSRKRMTKIGAFR